MERIMLWAEPLNVHVGGVAEQNNCEPPMMY